MKTTNGRDFSYMSFSNKKITVLNLIVCICIVIVLVVFAFIGLAEKNVLMFVLSVIGIPLTFLLNAIVQTFVEISESIFELRQKK